ncbi:MAG TPA: hypothetical protein ENN84_06925 [Candidatus Marinimicrobia bacterium]|nr:hypothetical protein [Candidatus Neomarinimicrobiota bacterium]
MRLAFLVMEHRLDYRAPRPVIPELQEIGEAVDSKAITIETSGLSAHQKLLENGDYICYFA